MEEFCGMSVGNACRMDTRGTYIAVIDRFCIVDDSKPAPDFHSAALPAVLCFMAGTALSAFSPGTLGRAGANTAPLLDRMLLGIFNYLVFVRISWLLLVAVVVAWFCRRDVLKEEIRRNYVLYFAMLMSLGIVLVCGQTEARVCFHADFIALLLLVSLLVRSGVFVADGYSYSFAYRNHAYWQWECVL